MSGRSSDDSGTASGLDAEEFELEGSPEIELDEPADPVDSGIASRSSSASASEASVGTRDTALPPPARIRRMLAEAPERLEAGLRAYTDKKGAAVGVDFTTPVGEIDLLALDQRGAFVVVLVAEVGQEADLAAQMLQRMGWVQKHLVSGKQTVRGFILASNVPESLLYAGAALPGGVTIVTYRMALTFEPVEV